MPHSHAREFRYLRAPHRVLRYEADEIRVCIRHGVRLDPLDHMGVRCGRSCAATTLLIEAEFTGEELTRFPTRHSGKCLEA